MVEPWVGAILSVAVVSALSVVGVLTLLTPALRRHGLLVALVGLAAGALMGDAFLHLLPETVEATGGLGVGAAGAVLAGFFLFFLLEVAFRWHHAHGELEHEEHSGHHAVQPFGWLNLIGDGIHNLLDGALIAAAYLVDTPLGVATTVAVALHELPQEFGDFAVLLRAGMRPARAVAFNLLSASVAFVGAVAVLVAPLPVGALERYALPVIAGGFIYIAAADLVPELHHHTGTRALPVIIVAMAAGIASMAALLLVEV